MVFEAVFRRANFTRAAEELNLSQASVSRQIKQLEDDLGVQLFERGRHNVRPTALAIPFAEAVNTALSGLAETAAHVRAHGDHARQLVVFTDITLAETTVGPCLSAFHRAFPDVQIRVNASALPIDAVPQDFHIGVVSGIWSEERYEIERIGDDSLFPVCAPSVAARLPVPYTVADLMGETLLHFQQAGRRWPDWESFLAGISGETASPRKDLVFESYPMILDSAERGDGIALGWSQSVRHRLATGKLVRPEGPTLRLPDYIGAYFPKNRPRNRYALSFAKLLTRRFQPFLDTATQ